MMNSLVKILMQFNNAFQVQFIIVIESHSSHAFKLK